MPIRIIGASQVLGSESNRPAVARNGAAAGLDRGFEKRRRGVRAQLRSFLTVELILEPRPEKKFKMVLVVEDDEELVDAVVCGEAAACGGGVAAPDVGVFVVSELVVIGAVTGAEAVPAVVPLELAVDAAATTPTRSGLGSAVPRIVAGVGVLGVALADPEALEAAALGVTVPAGVRLAGVAGLAVAVAAVAFEGVGAEGSLDSQSTVTSTPPMSEVLVADTTVFGVAFVDVADCVVASNSV
jgi:hypothetical protein